ncbi:hypothetical protein H0H93_013263 [Arthromyces matolae]|nr:hypothetical protein H0H93_013263 [Arthromyces matolae]
MPDYYPEDEGDVEQQNLIAESSDESDDNRTPECTLSSSPVPDNYIGGVSSAMFAGMMFGAIGWGTCSDILGRSAAFNATLCFTALFGLFASFANSFTTLCIVLFFLGSAVGGSMPTDGTLLLEHMPKSKQYLVTALSVFFSFGAVLSAVVALIVIPNSSCLPNQPCNVDTDNQGWRHLLMTLGLITLSMFIARILFFRLHESPRYLVHAGRHQEAIESLQMISRFNGSDLTLEIKDVQDQHDPTASDAPPRPIQSNYHENDSRPRASSTTIFNASDIPGDTLIPSISSPKSGRPTLVTQYNATDAADTGLDQEPSSDGLLRNVDETDSKPPSPVQSTTVPRSASRRPRRARQNSTSSVYEKRFWESMPRIVRRPLSAWWDRIKMVLSPEWLRTTLLVWVVWCAMSLAFTMFNVFLPKLLEARGSEDVIASEAKSLDESLWDVVIFTVGGCPGAISMWAVLYGWTPEIFGTKVRGTACGIASALSRIGGMIAPMLGGTLLMINQSIPVYTSVVVFVFAGFCVLLIRETPTENHLKGERLVVH